MPVAEAGRHVARIWFTQPSQAGVGQRASARRSSRRAAMPQPMSTPTADGITAVSVAMTDPIVAPIPKWASGIRARWPARIGSRAVRAACSVVSSSSSLAQERTFGAISFGMTLTPSFVSRAATRSTTEMVSASSTAAPCGPS